MQQNVFIENFTLLEKEHIRGGSRLDLLKQNGNACEISDFAILLGGDCYQHDVKEKDKAKTKDSTEVKDKVEMRGWWWAKTDRASEADFASAVYEFEPINHRVVRRRNGGVRPVICLDKKVVSGPISKEEQIKSEMYNNLKSDGSAKKIKYGAYPQTVVEKDLSEKIESEYQNGNLTKTQMKYTTDKISSFDMETSFEEKDNFEYEYNGEKYIRLVANENCVGKKLSDGRIIEMGEVYWVKVEPINWLIDRKTGIIISEKILFSGIQFRNSKNTQPGFDNTDIKKFLNEYFSKEFNMENERLEILERFEELEKLKETRKKIVDEFYSPFSDVSYRLFFTILKMSEIQNFRGEPTDLFKEIGVSTSATDFARLLGCKVNNYPFEKTDLSPEEYSGSWYTRTPGKKELRNLYKESVKVIDDYYGAESVKIYKKNVGVRPEMVCLAKDILKYPMKQIKETKDTIEMEYGEYPQTVVDEMTNNLFERRFNPEPPGKLGKVAESIAGPRPPYFIETGKNYTILDENNNEVLLCEYADPFDRKYVRLVADEISKNNVLSNGKKVQIGKAYWIEVEPVRWIISKSKGTIVSKQILFSGVPVQKDGLYSSQSDFEETFLQEFLNRRFSMDIMPIGLQRHSGTGQR